MKGNIVERYGDVLRLGLSKEERRVVPLGARCTTRRGSRAAAEAEFAALNGDPKTIFQMTHPTRAEPPLLGYAAGGSGRDRAEGSAAEANAGLGVTHRTLEKTLVKIDGVAKTLMIIRRNRLDSLLG